MNAAPRRPKYASHRGHPVYSLTVTLFSLLLGTGTGSFLSRRIADARVRARLVIALLGVALLSLAAIVALPPIIRAAVGAPLAARIALAVALLFPAGVLMGIPLPAGVRLLVRRQPDLLPWAWAMNGALSVLGATLAVFIAMNWGFSVALLTGGLVYATAAGLVARASR
jgi:predicted membrane-bound spermidine synthase